VFDLTKQEKLILVFLILTFATGVGISAYKKSRPRLKEVQLHQAANLEDADRFISEYNQVNINRFDIGRLTRLPGIGEVIAQRIVEYRKLHGPFKSKEELMQVKGIGARKFEQIKDSIVLE
jgi:competence ComEA-like helix-hairpin-helix protein